MKRNLRTVPRFVEESNGVFSEGQLRWWIFNADKNGMADDGVVVRLGRRVYIDVDRFDEWVDAQQAPEEGRASA